MSIIGALQSGVSGLNAQSQSMSVIANNISNVSTVGYKASRTAFSTLVTQTVAATGFSTGGVQAESLQLNDVQGLLQQTSSATDMAISGDGFFVVNNESEPGVATGQFMFTRAGQFVPNEDGDLANTAGLFLQGWPIDETGDIPSNRTDLNVLETVNVRGLTGSAEATSEIKSVTEAPSSRSMTRSACPTRSLQDAKNKTLTFMSCSACNTLACPQPILKRGQKF